MPLGLAVLSELSHYGSLLPVLACIGLVLWHYYPRPEARLLSIAFLVSFFADSIAAQFAREGLSTWWLGYLYAPLQFGIVAATIAISRSVRVAAIAAIGVMALYSGLVHSNAGPETTVRILGGLMIGFLLWGRQDLGRYRLPLVLYTVGAVPFLFGMQKLAFTDPWWVVVWAGYMGLRIVALGLMAWAVFREEVIAHGRNPLDQHRAGLRLVGGGDRDVVARSPAQR